MKISYQLISKQYVADYLSKQQSLRLQIQSQSMPIIIQKVLQLQELNSTHLTIILPRHRDYQLP